MKITPLLFHGTRSHYQANPELSNWNFLPTGAHLMKSQWLVQKSISFVVYFWQVVDGNSVVVSYANYSRY